MKNKHIVTILSTLLLLSATNSGLRAASIRTTPEKAAAAVRKAAPGDSIVIANGTYTDIRLALQGNGEQDKPIVVTAESPGKVIFEGESNLRIAGKWLVVSGFWFRNGFSPTGTVIEYRQGTRHATDCRVTECAIESFNPESRQTKGNWVQFYGHRNRLDHCSIVGKLNEGVTIAAVLNGTDHQHHRIDNNYFGPRPVYGSNGAETIRTGNSFTSTTPSFIVIEDNYFDRCSGEVEILSIKSADNTIRRNTFFECEGGIALRHGDRNTVESNVMIGNGKPNTGGIRIINKGHRIYNNYLRGLAGRRAFAPLAVMNGVPDSPEYRYHQVTDTEIANNTLDSCGEILFCLGKDFERTETPQRVTFSGNLIADPCGGEIYTAFDDISGIRFTGNKITDGAGTELPAGFAPAKENARTAQGIIYDAAPAAKRKASDLRDLTGNPVRTQGFAGAIDRANASRPVTAAAKDKVGAKWFSYTEPRPDKLSGRTIEVTPGKNTLLRAVALSQPGDVLRLTAPGEYWNDASVVIPHFLRIEAAGKSGEKPILRYNGRGNEPIIMIGNGGRLDLAGVAFNGIPEERLHDPKGFIGTAATMIEDYALDISDCDFSRFNRSGTYAISCSKGTFAQRIAIRDCRFFDLPWDAIVLTRETDFYGRYNVENLEITNCLFANIGGRGIDLSRLGYDESTAGPNVRISHCTFYNVFNREQGSVIDLTGVQKASVADCTFDKSGQGGACIRFNEMRWDEIEVSHCNFYEAGRIASFWDTCIKGGMLQAKPVYAAPENNDFRQSPASPLANKATDGKNIGIN